jgi:hypothetical protein
MNGNNIIVFFYVNDIVLPYRPETLPQFHKLRQDTNAEIRDVRSRGTILISWNSSHSRSLVKEVMAVPGSLYF